MTCQTVMTIDTPKPKQVHVLWLSCKAPFASGHTAVITEDDSDKRVMARSMKLDTIYDVQIYNRKKEWIDAFEITYTYSEFHGKPIIVKHLGHY